MNGSYCWKRFFCLVAMSSCLLLLAGCPPKSTVPELTGKTQAQAQAALEEAGLTLGAVTEQFSATVPAGQVIGQDPAAGAESGKGESVNLVVSKGPQPVTVPHVVNETQVGAQTVLEGNSLTLGTVSHAFSDTAPVGQVISQNPTAGEMLAPGSPVNVTVSDGPAQVAVPNVVGQTQTQAGAMLTAALLTLGAVTQGFSNTVPAGQIVSQNPVAGAQAANGSAVAVVVSQGVAIPVPNVVGQTQTQAQAALLAVQLAVGLITNQFSTTIPANEVISQNPPATTLVGAGAAVALVVSSGLQPVVVPDVVGLQRAAAEAAIVAAGLTVGLVTEMSSDTAPKGEVISQNPTSGAQVPSGSAVTLVVSAGEGNPTDAYVSDLLIPEGGFGIWAANDMTMDGAGNLYIAWGKFVILKVSPEGELLQQYDLYDVEGTVQNVTFSGIALDGAGNIFAAETIGDRVIKFSPAGAVIGGWGSLGTGPGQFTDPQGVAVDGSGNVYVVDYGNNRIQKFSSDGTYLAQWGGSGTGNGQFNQPQGIYLDAGGNLWVSEWGNNRVQKFTTEGGFVMTLGTAGSGDGAFNKPVDVTVDSTGNVFVSEVGNHRVQKFSSSGAYITQWLGSGLPDDEQFSYPGAMVTDGAGKLYVADRSLDRVQIFTGAGAYVSTLGGGSKDAGFFNNPGPVATDSNGNLFVLDGDNSRVQKFSPTGAFLTEWGRRGTENGEFYGLDECGVVVDAAGNVYVSDRDNDRIQKFSNTGAYLLQWNGVGSAAGGLSNPSGLAIAPDGNIAVCDRDFHRIQFFSPEGVYVSHWGAQGSGPGQLNTPRDLAYDSLGNLFVADSGNYRVQKFAPDGTFLIQWGVKGAGQGQFNYPSAIDVDSTGRVYVSDLWNDRVQIFDGTGSYLLSLGGTGAAAGWMKYPLGVAVDKDDNLYVSEGFNYRVQRFHQETP